MKGHTTLLNRDEPIYKVTIVYVGVEKCRNHSDISTRKTVNQDESDFTITHDELE